MMKRYVTFIFTLLFSYLTVFTQVYHPVKWHFSSKKESHNIYELRFEATIKKGWHMYGLHIPEGGPVATSFTFDNDSLLSFKSKIISLHKPVVKYDSTFRMHIELFSNKVVFVRKIEVPPGRQLDVTGKVDYMVCDNARCLPPTDVDFEFHFGHGIKSAGSNVDNASSNKQQLTIKKTDTGLFASAGDTVIPNKVGHEQIKPVVTSQEDQELSKKEKSLWAIFFAALLAGFGAMLTPCVYPIIPLTVTYFMKGHSRSRSVFNGILFGASIVFIYTMVGLIAGLFRIDLVRLVSSYWLPNLIFFLIFIALAVSFFGMFDITLPGSISNKIDQRADKGGVLGPFFMALATVVISFSCTGPLVGLTLGSALHGDIIRPVVGMFGFSLTFALPFTLLAIFPNALKNLPKSGGWLNAVKVFIAFIMLLSSLIFLGNMGASRQVVLALAIVITALLGLYLIGKIKFAHDSDVTHISVPRIILAILAFGFAIYMVPGLFGAPLNAIAPFLPPQDPGSFTLAVQGSGPSAGTMNQELKGNVCTETPKFSQYHLEMPLGLKGYFDYDEALQCARQLHKPVLIDFSGESCKNCKKMYAEVWSKPEVYNKIRKDFIITVLYTDNRTTLPQSDWVTSPLDGRVKKTIGEKFNDLEIRKFGSNALPLYAIVDEQGNVLTKEKYRTYSPDVQLFLNFLNEGVRNYKKHWNNSK